MGDNAVTPDPPRTSRSGTGSRIGPYAGQYASRARGTVAAEIRALFTVPSQPEVAPLAAGSRAAACLGAIAGRGNRWARQGTRPARQGTRPAGGPARAGIGPGARRRALPGRAAQRGN